MGFCNMDLVHQVMLPYFSTTTIKNNGDGTTTFTMVYHEELKETKGDINK